MYMGDTRTGDGAQIGGLLVSHVIKITVVRRMRMSPTSTAVWAWRQTRVKRRTAREERGLNFFAFVLRVWSAKTRGPPIWAPCLTTPLHGAVYGIWDLPCISVVLPKLLYQISIYRITNTQMRNFNITNTPLRNDRSLGLISCLILTYTKTIFGPFY